MPALYVVLEREIPEFDSYVDGHALSNAERKLERIAKKLNVTHLMDFFSQNPEDAAAFIEDEGGDPDEIDLPDEQWFEPADGLAAVNALLEHFHENPDAIGKSDEIRDELKQWKAVLERADSEGIRWHLAVDF